MSAYYRPESPGKQTQKIFIDAHNINNSSVGVSVRTRLIQEGFIWEFKRAIESYDPFVAITNKATRETKIIPINDELIHRCLDNWYVSSKPSDRVYDDTKFRFQVDTSGIARASEHLREMVTSLEAASEVPTVVDERVKSITRRNIDKLAKELSESISTGIAAGVFKGFKPMKTNVRHVHPQDGEMLARDHTIGSPEERAYAKRIQQAAKRAKRAKKEAKKAIKARDASVIAAMSKIQ